MQQFGPVAAHCQPLTGAAPLAYAGCRPNQACLSSYLQSRAWVAYSCQFGTVLSASLCLCACLQDMQALEPCCALHATFLLLCKVCCALTGKECVVY